jgi:hypothetical protein
VACVTTGLLPYRRMHQQGCSCGPKSRSKQLDAETKPAHKGRCETDGPGADTEPFQENCRTLKFDCQG